MASRRLTALGAALVAAMALGAYVSAPPVAGTQAFRAASRIRLGQLLRPSAKLGDGGEGGESESPTSVALSSNGDTAMVGAPDDDGGVGSVSVFTRSGSTWIQQGATLTGKDNSVFARFGVAVALSGAGDTALVGAGGEGGEQGAAWIFTRSRSIWQRRKKLTGRGETPLGNFGESVALSSNGKIALIGCPQDNRSGLQRAGAAWMFSGAGSSWTQRAQILAPATSGEDGLFGLRLALSGTGTTALVGVDVDDGDPGTAWVLAD